MFRFENHRVHFWLVPASHVTMTPLLKNICSQNLLNLMSVEREFRADQFCYKTYSLFLSVFGLLAFKEYITWPWYKGWFCFFCETYGIMYHSKENFMLINICKRIYSWYLSFLVLLTFKEFATWPWCKRWFCFSRKIYRIWYHWKEYLQ